MSARRSPRLVALDLPPGEAFTAALRAAWDAGDAVLPLDPRAPHPAKRRVIDRLRPHLIVDTAGQAAYPDPAPLDDDVALVIVTSGSTGEPKGAQLSRAAVDASLAGSAERLGRAPSDRWLSCLPWHHIGGLLVPLRAWRDGTAVTVLPRFDPAAVARAIADGATLTAVVPAMLRRLREAGADLPAMRVVLVGGAALSPALAADLRAAGAPLVTTYGMSETCGGCVYDGLPLPGVRVRIGVGDRIELAGPTLMRGYRCRPDLDPFTADGWLRTNDVGRFASDGRLEVVGRADDVIVSGGEKVVAAALAAQVDGHPAVAEAAVVGVPDERWGERVVAVVELVPGASLRLDELREFLSAQVPGWSLPRGLVVVPRIPRLASGKPDRLALGRLARGA